MIFLDSDFNNSLLFQLGMATVKLMREIDDQLGEKEAFRVSKVQFEEERKIM